MTSFCMGYTEIRRSASALPSPPPLQVEMVGAVGKERKSPIQSCYTEMWELQSKPGMTQPVTAAVPRLGYHCVPALLKGTVKVAKKQLVCGETRHGRRTTGTGHKPRLRVFVVC